jgi:hypothetical protein
MARQHGLRREQLQLRRQRVAAGAARLIARLGLHDYREAKQRAARELGIADEASLPSDALVREQVLEYQRLFRGEDQARALRERREAALEAMDFFTGFHPRLVGNVLDGTADAGSPVRLQLFAEDPDTIARFLLDADMPTRTQVERRLILAPGQRETFQAWLFTARGIDFEATALPLALLRQPPLGEDGKPQARANAAAVRILLATDDEP